MSEVTVAKVNDIKPGAAKRFDVEGHRLCVVHIADDWYVIGDECSHADYSLSEGDVWEDEREIECWKHGSTFSLVTGEPQTLRPGRLDRHPFRPDPEHPGQVSSHLVGVGGDGRAIRDHGQVTR